MLVFCFSSRRRHTRCALVTGVSDMCSSDLLVALPVQQAHRAIDSNGAVEQPVRFARMPESLGRHFGRIAIFRGFFNAALAQNLQFLFLRKAPVRKIRRGGYPDQSRNPLRTRTRPPPTPHAKTGRKKREVTEG